MSVKDSYLNGVCPDCGEPIPDNAVDGQACVNCGHAFFEDYCDSEYVGEESIIFEDDTIFDDEDF